MPDIKMAAASPMTRYLLEMAGVGGDVPTGEMDVGEEIYGHPPPDHSLRGYDLELKKKRHKMILRQMLERNGMHELARMSNIRDDRGGDDDYG